MKHGTPTAFLPAGSHPLSAWLRLHLESNHYYPTIIPLLSHYYPIFTKFVRIFFQPLSLMIKLVGKINWEHPWLPVPPEPMEEIHWSWLAPWRLPVSIQWEKTLNHSTCSTYPMVFHGFLWFSLCRPLVRPEWPSKQKNWSRPQPGLIFSQDGAKNHPFFWEIPGAIQRSKSEIA